MTRSSFQTFLGTIRGWLQGATDPEVLTLHALITAELARRRRTPDDAAVLETPSSRLAREPDTRHGE